MPRAATCSPATSTTPTRRPRRWSTAGCTPATSAELDDDGYLRIVDRKKELIITAGGKNVSPANLEAALKTIPLVGQAMAVGDDRPFVAALVVLDPEVAPVWARQPGHRGRVAGRPGRRSRRWWPRSTPAWPTSWPPFNHAERVKKVKVLGEEWLPDSDLLTPTSKLKRRGVLARYHDEIEALYSDSGVYRVARRIVGVDPASAAGVCRWSISDAT